MLDCRANILLGSECVHLESKKTVVLEERIRTFIRYLPIPAGIKLGWIKKLIDREFKKEIGELRKKGTRSEIESKEHDYFFEMHLIFADQEALYTERMLKKARRLRVQIPSMPKYSSHREYEESEDWEQGPEGSWNLTVKGIAKVREEIRKEEKWRREGRANWAAFLSALGGVIGTVIGLIALLRK